MFWKCPVSFDLNLTIHVVSTVILNNVLLPLISMLRFRCCHWIAFDLNLMNQVVSIALLNAFDLNVELHILLLLLLIWSQSHDSVSVNRIIEYSVSNVEIHILSLLLLNSLWSQFHDSGGVNSVIECSPLPLISALRFRC